MRRAYFSAVIYREADGNFATTIRTPEGVEEHTCATKTIAQDTVARALGALNGCGCGSGLTSYPVRIRAVGFEHVCDECVKDADLDSANPVPNGFRADEQVTFDDAHRSNVRWYRRQGLSVPGLSDEEADALIALPENMGQVHLLEPSGDATK